MSLPRAAVIKWDSLAGPFLSSHLRHPAPAPAPGPVQYRPMLDALSDKLTGVFAKLGSHGTIVYMPACDRLSSRKARTLCEHAVSEMARIYRRAISSGLKLYVNNRRVEAFDPTYSMASARHVRMLAEGATTTSRLVLSRPIEIPVTENDPTRSAPVVAKSASAAATSTTGPLTRWRCAAPSAWSSSSPTRSP